jgi:hypothetical protein
MLLEGLRRLAVQAFSSIFIKIDEKQKCLCVYDNFNFNETSQLLFANRLLLPACLLIGNGQYLGSYKLGHC